MTADFRFAIRALRRVPGFFLLAAVTLALGIAANTSIFSLFYQVLLRSLPVTGPERLVVLHSGPPGLPGGSSSDNSETVFSYPLYLRMRDAARGFQGILARSGAPAQISVGGVAERGGMEVVSGNFFQVLGLRPQIGRLLGPADDTVRGGNPVTVLSFEFWQRRFGGNVSALNRKLLLNGVPFTIVGVAPPNFHGVLSGQSPELFVPISMKAALEPGWNSYGRPNSQWLNLIGRLAPGVSRQAAAAQLQPLFSAVIRDHVKRIGVHSKSAEQRLLAKKVELRPASQGLNELERQWKQPLLPFWEW